MAPPTKNEPSSVPPKRRDYDKGNGRLFMVKWTHIAALVALFLGAGGIWSLAHDSRVDKQIDVHKGPEPVRARLRDLEQTVSVVKDNKSAIKTLDERQQKFHTQQQVMITKLDTLINQGGS